MGSNCVMQMELVLRESEDDMDPLPDTEALTARLFFNFVCKEGGKVIA